MVANSSSERQRRYRERRRAGRRIIRLEIDVVEVAAVLESLGFLDPLIADDDEAVQRALHDMLEVFMADDA